LKPPSVVAASEAKIEERPPPPGERRTSHKWLGERSKQEYERKNDRLELYVSKLSEEKIRNHAMSAAQDRLEVMGFLLGNVYRNGDVMYSLVRDVATTDLEASSVRVRFQREGMERLFASIDDCGFSYILLGWYHSHPGHRCFLSPTDVDTQTAMFSQSYHSALVIDPVHKEIEAFCIEKGRAVRRPFAVYWDQYQNPYFGETVKRRRLKTEGSSSPENEPTGP